MMYPDKEFRSIQLMFAQKIREHGSLDRGISAREHWSRFPAVPHDPSSYRP